MIERICRECGTLLIVGENITQRKMNKCDYRCRACENMYLTNYRQIRREHMRNNQRAALIRAGQYHPMSENRDCALFLGVCVAERVLANVFKDVMMMPNCNPGYDFICNKDKKIDVKSACRNKSEKWSDSWAFHIGKNAIADYFLLLAFDNRDNLVPEHLWLIPGRDINDHMGTGISESRLDKWAQYEKPIDEVLTCCNVLRGD